MERSMSFRFPIYISAGGDGADQFIVNDEDDTTGDVFSITDNTIGGSVPPGAAVDAEGVPSPVVDGVISPQEWDFAGRLRHRSAAGGQFAVDPAL